VTVTPSGLVTFTLPESQTSLPPGPSTVFPVTLTAPAGNPPPGPVSMVVKITGKDSTSGLSETGSAMVIVTLRSSVSVPVLIPSAASAGVNPGGSLVRTFTVRNDGYAPINNATVTLQNPGALDWVALGDSSLGTIVPGDSRQFSDRCQSVHECCGRELRGAVHDQRWQQSTFKAPSNISVTQLSMGSAAFVVSDDIGAKVSAATVTLYGKTNAKSFQGVTDITGQVLISGVDAGDYAYVVVADTRDPLSGSVTVTAGASHRKCDSQLRRRDAQFYRYFRRPSSTNTTSR